MKTKLSSWRFWGKLNCQYFTRLTRLTQSLLTNIKYKFRNFELVIFKQPEKQMHREGPILLSTMKVKKQNIMQQLRTDLIEIVTNQGFE